MLSDGLPASHTGIATPDYLQALATQIWREACRHIQISESTETIAAVLARHLPTGCVLVRTISPQQGLLETVAEGLVDSRRPCEMVRTEYPSEDMERLLRWCHRGQVAWRQRDDSEVDWGLLLPAGVENDALAGPLSQAGQPSGVLILIAEPGRGFEPHHECMMQLLLEPFSTALENDRRLRDVKATRAAAEADKRSLLTRLGRKNLSDVIVGADSGLRAVMERVELVARADVPALILGETGTGKEVIARAIHTQSARAKGPFLRVNCGAIPLELVDSQLFGHEKGAFTGAVESHQGWFERADGGTLLLDEIGELPLAAQVRLLRILQDGWLERVGGHTPINVDVRIIAATHRDLATMVTQGKFREDLWYRIAVFPILLPPLRERPGDVAELARHFAERAAARFLLPLALPSAEDVELLTSYAWPGNIRELAAVIDRAAILGDGDRLEVAKALGVPTRHSPAPSSDPVVPSARESREAILPLDEAMKRHIEAALSASRGRIEGRRGAASVLRINPHTLRARMRKLGIDWTKFREDD